jgi:predicted unusual protein kinase regulating ubiquinone biosynthesis (AarF/ABC1/UbiB family)
LPGADLSLLKKAETQMFQYFWGKSMNDLTQIKFEEMHEFAFEFRDLLYSMPFQIPQDMIFLGRAVGILSGMCTGLDPQFNVFEHLVPFSQKLIAEETKNEWGFWIKQAGEVARKLFMLPMRTDAMLSKMESGDLIVRDPQLTDNVRRLERAILKATGGIIFTGFLVASLQLFQAQNNILGWLFAVASAGALLWTLLRK